MILLVCGGRKFDDRKRLYELLDHLKPSAVVHGCAPGADEIAGDWARLNGVPEIRVPANWNFYDHAAGGVRNGWMVDFIRIDKVLAVRGETGTADMIRRAKIKGIQVLDVREAT